MSDRPSPLQLMTTPPSAWPTYQRTRGRRTCRSCFGPSVPSLGSIWPRTRTLANPRCGFRRGLQCCLPAIALETMGLLNALCFLHRCLIVSPGFCIHQFPSTRGCGQSYRWCVWLRLWSPDPQRGMGQVSHVPVCHMCLNYDPFEVL